MAGDTAVTAAVTEAAGTAATAAATDKYQIGRNTMKLVIQRVERARVRVGGETVGEIGGGLLVLAGIGAEDGEADCERLAAKLVNLRIFSDSEGKTNLSIKDVGGELLVISQFTLYADCRKGNRPNFPPSFWPGSTGASTLSASSNWVVMVPALLFSSRIELSR